jgi:hypothetical protein
MTQQSITLEGQVVYIHIDINCEHLKSCSIISHDYDLLKKILIFFYMLTNHRSFTHIIQYTVVYIHKENEWVYKR